MSTFRSTHRNLRLSGCRRLLSISSETSKECIFLLLALDQYRKFLLGCADNLRNNHHYFHDAGTDKFVTKDTSSIGKKPAGTLLNSRNSSGNPLTSLALLSPQRGRRTICFALMSWLSISPLETKLALTRIMSCVAPSPRPYVTVLILLHLMLRCKRHR